MFIVRVQGGFGNQISQYAFSRWLSKNYPGHEVKLDLDWFLEWGWSEFELVEYFKREYQVFKIATRREVQKATKVFRYKAFQSTPPEKIYEKTCIFLRNIAKKNTIICQPIVSGYPLPNEILKLDTRKDWYFDGTWHSLDYTDILSNLQAELIYQDCNLESFLNWKREIQTSESISLHIRQGDYVGTERDILPQSNYYKHAIEIIKGKFGNQTKFFVFSDDEKFASEYMAAIDCNFRIVTKNNRPSYTDMVLMSLCRGNICANSTYSYWAACLNKNPGKMIIIPEKYTKSRKMWCVPYCINLPID